jgi:hypothetical protein
MCVIEYQGFTYLLVLTGEVVRMHEFPSLNLVNEIEKSKGTLSNNNETIALFKHGLNATFILD